jgi:hypothetical protein
MSGIQPGTYVITLVPPVRTLTPGLPRRASGPFAGMPVTALQAALATAQQALIALTTGTQPVMVSYAEGQGKRDVMYNRANSNDLRQLIRDLQFALGIAPRLALGVRIR